MTVRDRGPVTKGLAVTGAALAWLPLLAPVAFALASVGGGRLRFDWLMPAELFPLAVTGAGLLLWAALRARSHRRVIGVGLAAMVVTLVAGMLVANLTGLASGAEEPTGWRVVVVTSFFALYALAVLVTAAAGALLTRALFVLHPAGYSEWSAGD